jgi:choline dehydrogenase-like flavoprotein
VDPAPHTWRRISASEYAFCVLTDIADCDDSRLRADICIIGAGAAGITLACELEQSKLSVVVLEGGGAEVEPALQELNQCEIAGLFNGGSSAGRFRAFGGTTRRWAGQALPLSEMDFRPRDWVPYSGWPISRAELEPYYIRAAAVLGIGAFMPPGSNGETSPLKYAPSFDSDLLVPFVSRFSPHPDLARKYGDVLTAASTIRVVLHATVTELLTDEAATCVVAARGLSMSGRSIDVEANTFVVCAGGIETARLLLVSDRYADGGLGNDNDLVGRFFQDHPGLRVGAITPVSGRRVRSTFRPRRVRGIRYQPLFRASDALQSAEKLLNVGGAVLFDTPERSYPIAAGKVLYRATRDRHFGTKERDAVRTVIRHPSPLLAASARHFILRQPALDTSGPPYLVVAGEQTPNPESRILLSPNRDILGVRQVVLDWRLTHMEITGWRRIAELAASELERLEFGRVDFSDFEIPDDPAELSGYVVDANHHMGTARMASDRSDGVVDCDTRVFGTANLYLASSAVFPTSGFSNPTLTIIALAIRLADHLKATTANMHGARPL